MIRVIISVILAALLPLSGSHASGARERPRIGLALSGGGARGLAHIGVLKVLEEERIPIDIVTGNSMGAVMGALYAIGYSAAEIERIAIETDWIDLFSEKIDRKYIPIEDKEKMGRYFAAFNLEGYRVRFLPGLISGQKTYNLLSRLLWPVRNIDDFSRLPKPFSCVATDIATGEAVFLRNGNLPDAIRASMAIPGAFSPIKIDGRLLVDGLLVLDFPVEEAFGLGADIVIGVDVGFQPLPADSIRTLMDILSQSLRLHQFPNRAIQAAMCDILIMPELDDYTAFEFKTAEIIRRGEEAAGGMIEEIRGLSRSLGGGPEPAIAEPRAKDTELICDIRIVGAGRTPAGQIRTTLGLEVPAEMTAGQIEKAVDRVAGSGSFNMVRYHIDSSRDCSTLVVIVDEDEKDYLYTGLRYDTTWDTSLLLNVLVRDLLLRNSRLELDALLGKRIRLGSSYRIGTGFMNRFGIRVSADYLSDWIDIYEGKDIVTRMDVKNFLASLRLQYAFSRYLYYDAGINAEWSQTTPEIAPAELEKEWDKLTFISSEIWFDNLNRSNYPERGIMLKVRGEVAGKDLGNPVSFNRISGRFMIRMPLHDRVSLGGRFIFGSTRGGELPIHHRFYVGGAHSIFNFTGSRSDNFFGLKHQELSGRHAWIAGADLQIRVTHNLYFIMHGNYADTAEDWDELADGSDPLWGLGTTVGFETPLGPIESSASYGEEHGVLLFFSAGYKF